MVNNLGRALLLGAVVLLVGLGGVALAPSVAATHSCGFDPCPHPDDIFCLNIVKKFFPGLCPYG